MKPSFIPLKLNITRAVLLGLVYGLIELEFVTTSGPSSAVSSDTVYRIAYTALLILPFVNVNLWVWAADGILATTVQDSSYWLYDYLQHGTLPSQWAWYYPVLGHVPLLYFPAVPIIVWLYWKGSKYKVD